MAAATTAIVGTGLAAYQISEAQKAKKAAKREMNNYERQELNNAYEEMPISMRGFDYAAEANAVNMANATEAARGGGARTIVGAVPKIVAAGVSQNADLARYLDEQYNRRAAMIAGDNARIEGITENRDIANIAGLSSQLNAAKQDEMNGWLGLGSSLAYGANNGPREAMETYDAIQGIRRQNRMANPAQSIPLQPQGLTPEYTPFSSPYMLR